MKLKSFSQGIVKRALNISAWIDYAHWKKIKQFLATLFRQSFAINATEENDDSFETLLQKMSLSENDLKERQDQFYHIAKTWLGLFIAAILYVFYLVYCRAWLSVFSMATLSMMILSQAFRYHFWAFCIQQRDNPRTLKAWWIDILSGF